LLGGSFGLNKEFALASQAKTVVWAPAGIFCCFDQDFSGVVWKPFFIFNVPPKAFEKWSNEIDSGLGLGVSFRQVVRPIRFESPDQFFDSCLE